MKRLVLVLVMIICLGGATPNRAADLPLTDVCFEMDRLIDALLEMRISECFPHLSAKTPGHFSFTFIAKKSVLDDPQNRRAWLLAVVDAVGTAMTQTFDFPQMRNVIIDEISTTDRSMGKLGKFLVMPAETVKRVRNQLYNGEVGVADAYSQINSSIRVAAVLKK